ncbi:MAG: hypothetical protein J0H17_20475 [Rhizobiales bacterium]|nr:hypothetical protein [Hyphomicrobiales bacterium]
MAVQTTAVTRERVPYRAAISWACALILAMLVLLAPALWNGFPLLQYDTGGYLARWYEGYLVPSRPGAYGLFLLSGVTHDFWPVLLIQAALTVWMAALVLRTHGYGRRPFLLLAILAALSVLTTLPWIASILLTDIFVGLAVLAMHLLVFRAETLRRWEQAALLLLIAFAGATHSATLGLLLAMAVVTIAVKLFRRDFIPAGGAWRAAIAAVLCIIMTFAANFAIAGRIAWTPGGYGILFGRMLQQGLVVRYLDKHCATTAFKLCPYRSELPRDADAFLWGESVFNKLGRFDGLGDEMRTIVLGTLKEFPREQIEGAISGTVKQLISVGTGEGVVNSVWHTYAIMNRYTPSVVPAMQAARQQQDQISLRLINRIHIPIALLSLVLLPVWIMLGLRRSAAADFGRLATTVTVAVLINAAVCGGLSNPHDRYGARIIWLAGMVGLLGVVRMVEARRQPATNIGVLGISGTTVLNAGEAASN